jgi:hypothetical protein
VTGDYYAAEWQAGCWSECNGSYARSELNKSQIYLETISRCLHAAWSDCPSIARCCASCACWSGELSGGKDVVDHQGGHDDYANAVWCCAS